MVYPSNFDDNALTKILFDEFLTPTIKEAREVVFKEHLRELDAMLTTSSTQQSGDDASPPVAPPLPQYESADDIRAVLTLDGELEQITYIMEHIANLVKNIEYFKFAAATSPSQQPNDVMRGFSIVKCLERTLRYADTVPMPQWYEALEAWMAKHKIFTAASRNTILRFMWNLPSILSTAYTKKNVHEGWRKTGLMPMCKDIIIGHWPFHKFLTGDERKKLKIAGTKLSHIAKRDGSIGEADIESHLSDSIGDSKTIKYRAYGGVDVDCYGSSSSSDSGSSDEDEVTVERPKRKRRKIQKPLDQRHINQGRCMWLNHMVFIAKYRAVRKAKEDEAKAAEERKAAAAVKKAQKVKEAEARKAKKEQMAGLGGKAKKGGVVKAKKSGGKK